MVVVEGRMVGTAVEAEVAMAVAVMATAVAVTVAVGLEEAVRAAAVWEEVALAAVV